MCQLWFFDFAVYSILEGNLSNSNSRLIPQLFIIEITNSATCYKFCFSDLRTKMYLQFVLFSVKQSTKYPIIS